MQLLDRKCFGLNWAPPVKSDRVLLYGTAEPQLGCWKEHIGSNNPRHK
jgi:hypothetical protein